METPSAPHGPGSAPEPPEHGLEARVARLERLVETLLAAQPGTPASSGAARPAPGPRPSPGGSRPGPEPAAGRRPADPPWAAAPRAPRAPRDLRAQSERWLGRLGVAFVLLALAFLFKLALDRGWITPMLRVLLGAQVGAVMLIVGLRLEGPRKRYAEILLGGAIAVFYLVGFAAFRLYELVPHSLALSWMASVTVLALVLADRQERPSLASLGAAGGLATPFLVPAPAGGEVELTVYTCLILAGAGVVMLRHGWASLRVTLALGGMAVLSIALGMGAGLAPSVGVAFAWVLLGPAPFAVREPVDATAGPLASMVPLARALVARLVPVMLSVWAAVALSSEHGWGADGAGLLLIGAGLVFAGAAAAFAPRPLARAPALEVAALLVPTGTWIAVESEVALPLLVVQCAAMFYVARGVSGTLLPTMGHILGALVGLRAWTVLSVPLLDGPAVTALDLTGALAGIGSAAATGLLLEREGEARAWYLGAYVGFPLWIGAVLAPLPNGQALVTAAWGLVGAAVLAASFVRERRSLQPVGLATLALAASKLLLVDMARLDVVWRILLFMGFGAGFLVLSYLINRRDSRAS